MPLHITSGNTYATFWIGQIPPDRVATIENPNNELLRFIKLDALRQLVKETLRHTNKG